MGSVDVEAMCERLDSIERSNTILRYAVAGLGIALLAFAGVFTRFGRPAAAIEAQRFVLTDRSGETRATLALRDGEPALTLLDADGKAQVRLAGGANHSSSLDFRNGNHDQLSIGASSRGSSIQLLDARNTLVGAFYSWAGGQAGIALNRGLGGLRLAVEQDGKSQIEFADVKGATRGGWDLDQGGSVQSLGSEVTTLPVSSESSDVATANDEFQPPVRILRTTQANGLFHGGGSNTSVPSHSALAP